MASLVSSLLKEFRDKFPPENLQVVIEKLQSLGLSESAISYFLHISSVEKINFLASKDSENFNFLALCRFLKWYTTFMPSVLEYSMIHRVPLWLSMLLVREYIKEEGFVHFLKNIDDTFIFSSPQYYQCKGAIEVLQKWLDKKEESIGRARLLGEVTQGEVRQIIADYLGKKQAIVKRERAEQIIRLLIEKQVRAKGYFIIPTIEQTLFLSHVEVFTAPSFDFQLQFYPSKSVGDYFGFKYGNSLGRAAITLVKINSDIFVYIQEIQRFGPSGPFKNYQNWPNLVLDIVEKAAKKAGVKYVLLSSPSIVAHGPENLLELYYRKIPISRGYRLSAVSSLIPSHFFSSLVSSYMLSKEIWIKSP